MALISCPECGQENVSDRAVACPACGYPIKEHFDKIKAKEERIKQWEKERESINIDDEIDKCKKVIDDLERKIKGYKIVMVLCGIMGMLLILVQFWVGQSIELSLCALIELAVIYYMNKYMNKAKKDIESESFFLASYEKIRKKAL